MGYRRPPKHTRWKSGQSGNSKGRRKGAKNLDTIFHEALNETLEIMDKGKARKISAREGIVKRLIHQALKGDLKAVAYVLEKEPSIARRMQEVKRITSGMSLEEATALWEETLRRDREEDN